MPEHTGYVEFAIEDIPCPYEGQWILDTWYFDRNETAPLVSVALSVRRWEVEGGIDLEVTAEMGSGHGVGNPQADVQDVLDGDAGWRDNLEYRFSGE